MSDGTARRPPKGRGERVPYPALSGKKRDSRDDQWRSLLWSIKSAEQHGPRALRSLAVALSQVIRGEALRTLLLDAREHHKPGWSQEDLLWDETLPLTAAGDTLATLLRRCPRAISVEMSETAVFPGPWDRWRLFRAMEGLGADWGPWKQDANLFAIGWKPWPIVWVTNGNHSTMAALIQGGGRLKCYETQDFRDVLAAVDTDGTSWLRNDSGQAFAPVNSMPMAGIFLIGKRLAALGRR